MSHRGGDAMRAYLSIGLCGLAYFVAAGTASAQFDRNFFYNRSLYNNRPAFSPYLNLLRPGTNPAINFYGLVRPQQEFRSGINNLQSDIQGVGAAVARMNYQDNAIHETGHAAGFMTQ